MTPSTPPSVTPADAAQVPARSWSGTRDQEIWEWTRRESERQESGLELIASENYASPQVMAAQGTCLTERSVERLRAMLGDRFAVEITQAGFAL